MATLGSTLAHRSAEKCPPISRQFNPFLIPVTPKDKFYKIVARSKAIVPCGMLGSEQENKAEYECNRNENTLKIE